MRPRAANEWRDFWRDGGTQELAARLGDLAPHATRVATLLGSNAPVGALAAELGRIRGTNEPDDELAQSIYDWFHKT
jgi:hypothetical protein